MTKEQFLLEYLRLGEAKWEERELGEQLITLTASQRKAHQKSIQQADIIRNLEEDKTQCPASNTTTAQ